MLSIGAVLRNEATGRENIYLDGAVHGKSREEIGCHVDDIIAFADIGEFIDRPVHTYSSGMKGRLAFAMGAFVDPDILIIDETLAVGDAFFAEKSMRRMKDIANKGRIVFIVSHGLASIVEMCDRCLWLDQGRLVMDGAPKQVTAAYQAAVSQADEVELKRNSKSANPSNSGLMRAHCACSTLSKVGVSRAATVRAFEPLTIRVGEHLARCEGPPDLHVEILRVDGRASGEEASPRLLLERCPLAGRSRCQLRSIPSFSVPTFIASRRTLPTRSV